MFKLDPENLTILDAGGPGIDAESEPDPAKARFTYSGLPLRMTEPSISGADQSSNNAVASFFEGLSNFPRQTAAMALRALRGGDIRVSPDEEASIIPDTASMSLESGPHITNPESNPRINEFINAAEEQNREYQRSYAPGGVTGAITGAMAATPFSLIAATPGVAGGAVGGVPGKLIGSAGSAYLTQMILRDQFLSDRVRDRESELGRSITQPEVDDIVKYYSPFADEYAAWMSIPSAISHTVLGHTAGKVFGPMMKGMSPTLAGILGYAGGQAGEVATQGLAATGQGNVEYKAGLRPDVPGYLHSTAETAPVVLTQGLLMSGMGLAGAGAMAARRRFMREGQMLREAPGTPAETGNAASEIGVPDYVPESVAGSGQSADLLRGGQKAEGNPGVPGMGFSPEFGQMGDQRFLEEQARTTPTATAGWGMGVPTASHEMVGASPEIAGLAGDGRVATPVPPQERWAPKPPEYTPIPGGPIEGGPGGQFKPSLDLQGRIASEESGRHQIVVQPDGDAVLQRVGKGGAVEKVMDLPQSMHPDEAIQKIEALGLKWDQVPVIEAKEQYPVVESKPLPKPLEEMSHAELKDVARELGDIKLGQSKDKLVEAIKSHQKFDEVNTAGPESIASQEPGKQAGPESKAIEKSSVEAPDQLKGSSGTDVLAENPPVTSAMPEAAASPTSGVEAVKKKASLKQPWKSTREDFAREAMAHELSSVQEQLARIESGQDKTLLPKDRPRKVAELRQQIEKMGNPTRETIDEILEAYGHKESVQKRLAQGKSVPDEVLKGYPDLTNPESPPGVKKLLEQKTEISHSKAAAEIQPAKKQLWEKTRPEAVGSEPEIPTSPRPLAKRYGKDWESRPDAADLRKQLIKDTSARQRGLNQHRLYVERSNQHLEAVKQALNEGKAVSPEILADYPFLERQAQEQARKRAEVAAFTVQQKEKFVPKVGDIVSHKDMPGKQIEVTSIKGGTIYGTDVNTGAKTSIFWESARPVRGEAPVAWMEKVSTSGAKADDLRSKLSPVVEKLKGVLPGDVKVIQSESKLPANIRDHIEKNDQQGRGRGWLNPEDGKIYLVADNLSSTREGMDTLTHELFHYGLRRAMGDKIESTLRQVYTAKRSEAQDIFKSYNNLDPRNPDHQLRAAEEVLARMAQSGEKSSLVDRAVSAVKDFLRKAGFDISYSDRDIRSLIGKVGDYLRTGDGEGIRQAGEIAADMRSRELHDQMAEYERRLFGGDGDVWLNGKLPGASLVRARYNSLRLEAGLPTVTDWTRRPTISSNELRNGLAEPLADLSTMREGKPEQAREVIDKDQSGFVDFVKKGQPFERSLKAAAWPLTKIGGKYSLLTPEDFRLRPTSWMLERAKNFMVSYEPDPSGKFYWFGDMLKQARAGLIDNFGLSEEFVRRREKMESDKAHYYEKAREFVQGMREAKFGPEEAMAMQRILEGEALPKPEWEKISEPIRAAVIDLGREAVELGLISEESFERNYGSYLHRVYADHDLKSTPNGQSILRWFSGRAKRIAGQAFMQRGMNISVTAGKVADVLGAHPDVLLDHVGEKFDVVDQLSSNGSGKVVKRHIFAAGSEIPEQYRGDSYVDRGTWELRHREGRRFGSDVRDMAVLWRDYTPEERVAMGQIMDSRYTVARTFQLVGNDLATGKFFKDIAANPEWAVKERPEGKIVTGKEASFLRTWAGTDWVEVPETIVPRTGKKVKRYGDLAGMFVKAEVWRDIQETERMQQVGPWRELMSFFKANKTFRSPGTHMNNFVSNFMLADMADMRWSHVWDGVTSIAKNDEHYRDARLHGAFGSGFLEQEFVHDVLQPIVDEMNKDATRGKGYFEAQFGQWAKFFDKAMTGAKKVDDTMFKYYQLEDEVFRMGMYRKLVSEGVSKDEAARQARDQFLDYNIRAPWINALRRNAMPFLAYTYRAAPKVFETMLTQPIKFAKYYMLWAGLNAMGYMLNPGGEDKERAVMDKRLQGLTWFMAPQAVRMPFQMNGLPSILDITRWVPGGDVFDTNNSSSLIPGIPAPAFPTGPLTMIFDLLYNKSLYSGREIGHPDVDTTGEKFGSVADYLWKSTMPNAPWVPNSWTWQRWNDVFLDQKRDRMGRSPDAASALLSAFGVKLAPFDREYQRQQRMYELEDQHRQISRDMAQAQRDAQSRQQGMFPERAMRKYKEEQQGSYQKLQELHQKIQKLQ